MVQTIKTWQPLPICVGDPIVSPVLIIEIIHSLPQLHSSYKGPYQNTTYTAVSALITSPRHPREAFSLPEIGLVSGLALGYGSNQNHLVNFVGRFGFACFVHVGLGLGLYNLSHY